MGAPSLIDAQGQAVLNAVASLALWANFHVHGGIVSDGGTTQTTGVSGALNFDVDVTQIVDCAIGGLAKEKAASTDIDSDAGDDVNWNASSGVSIIFAVVLSGGAANDGASWVAIHGSVATTGSEASPSDEDISTAVGHDNWVRVCDVTINRTGSTTVTMAFDHTVRSRVVSVATIATTEADFRS